MPAQACTMIGLGTAAATAPPSWSPESTGQEISAFPDRPVPMVVVLAPWVEAGVAARIWGKWRRSEIKPRWLDGFDPVFKRPRGESFRV